MNTTPITIAGSIVWDIDEEDYRFVCGWSESYFENGCYHSDYTHYVFVCEHQINVDAPKVDLVQPQLDALDAKEADLRAMYHAAKIEIDAKRQSLLAIECTGA